MTNLTVHQAINIRSYLNVWALTPNVFSHYTRYWHFPSNLKNARIPFWMELTSERIPRRTISYRTRC